jgi:hypothetical protein
MPAQADRFVVTIKCFPSPACVACGRGKGRGRIALKSPLILTFSLKGEGNQEANNCANTIERLIVPNVSKSVFGRKTGNLGIAQCVRVVIG